MINTGIYRHNLDLTPQIPNGFVVLGRPRGGTTMAIRLLEAAGCTLGSNLNVRGEDRDFDKYLLGRDEDLTAMKSLISERSSAGKPWAFKAPHNQQWQVLEQSPSLSYLLVCRDTVAVAKRNEISASADFTASIMANIGMELKMMKFALAPERRTLLISYEKALLQPLSVAEEIIGFIGENPVAELIQKVAEVITAQDPKYLNS